MPFCRKCGTEVPENTNFCPKCGESQGSGNKVDIGKTNMENSQKKAPIISFSSFVLILLFCLLPFVSVKCSGQKIAEATGVELLTGNYSMSDKQIDEEKRKTNPFMVLVFLSAFAGIIFSIAFKNEGRKYKISVIGSAAIITISLILMQLYISYDVKSQSGQKDDFSAKIASMITINYEIGYWLCLLLPLALIAFTLFIKKEPAESGIALPNNEYAKKQKLERIEEKNKPKVGVIVGIVLGLVAVIAAVIFILHPGKSSKPNVANETIAENETPNKSSKPPATNKIPTKSETLTDPRDNRTYNTVVIGTQTWIAQNLNYDAEGSRCYGNDESNCQKYGRLYNWNAATKACPNGWHLPSNEEWQILVDLAGGNEVAGKKLKAENGWNDFEGMSGNGTDNYGFAALPGGLGNSDGKFFSIGNYGNWWSSSEIDGNRAYNHFKSYKHNNAGWESEAKNKLFSVRCVQSSQSESNSAIPGKYPQASERLLTDSDLQGISKPNLRIMRNEIFARHGYIFKSDDLKEHFKNQSWYAPKYSDVNSMLTSIEQKNIKFIQSYE